MSSFRGVRETVEEHGLFCALYADRATHYWHTPVAGGKVDKNNPTQVKRALDQLGIELIPAYSPEARGRSERMFRTLQDRLPKEMRLAGIKSIEEADRWLRETYIPAHNARFAVAPERPGSAFVADRAGAWRDILCVQEDRRVGNDNTVRWNGLVLQIPDSPLRHHFVRASVRVHEYPDTTLAVFHGPYCLARYDAAGNLTHVPGLPAVRRSARSACGHVDDAKRRPHAHRPHGHHKSGQLTRYEHRST